VSSSLTFTVTVAPNPPPILNSISPVTAVAGSPALTLTATGSSFIASSQIYWNAVPLVTTYVSATQLTASIPATSLTTAGVASVYVVSPAPGGGTTNTSGFIITAPNNPAPTLTSISPSSVTAGATGFTLTVSGTNFISSSVIKWNGATLTTTYVSATQLTAAIPASSVATAGTVPVTVFNPAPGGGTSTAVNFTINAAVTIKKVLFDASHAETAGNADWVIDEDNTTPQRVPTPAQSGITAGTAETYWTGAISSFGVALVKKGLFVETLPTTGSITYGNSSNTQDLSNYDVFVIDEPNNKFTTAEKTAIMNFISNGGGLFMVSDHTVSDRDNDGWDSPDIWNDLMTNNSVQANPFGFSVDLANFSDISTNVLTGSSSNVILNGTMGSVTKMEFNNGTTATLTPSANASVKGLMWKTGASQNNSNVMCLSSTYGNGRVFFVGDSSPLDDGTGNPNDTLYVGWSLYSHSNLFTNGCLWLAKLQ
jgi:hypothetical protein